MSATPRGKATAAVALVSLALAPPVVLWLLAGWPIPDAPSVRQSLELRWVSPELALQLAATVAWLSWTYVFLCMVAAAGAHLRHQEIRLPLPHTLSAYINTVIAILLVGSSLGGKHSASPPPRLTTTAAIQPAVPSPATTAKPASYEVRAHDTLWDIADIHLGDPLRWREIWRLNAGRVMQGGRTFDDPNLIQPGWVLTLHGPAEPRAEINTRRSIPEPPVVGHDPIEHAPVPAPVSPVVPDDPAPNTPSRSADVEPVTSPTGSATTPVGGGLENNNSDSTLPVGLGLGAAATGVLAILARRRRQRSRQRPVGQRVPFPTDDLLAAESALRSRANRDRTDQVTGALRLAAALGVQGGEPVLSRVIDTEAGIVLRFSEHVQLPEPFVEHELGWLLPGGNSSASFGAEDRADPAPALCAIGNDDNGLHYLNLESLGAVAIAGEKDAIDEVAGRMMLSLTATPWCELVAFCVVDPTLAMYDVVGAAKVIDVATELPRLNALAQSSRDATPESSSLAIDRWKAAEPTDGVTVILVPHDLPELDALLPLATDPRSPICLVVIGPHPGLPTLDASSGELVLPDQTRLVPDPMPREHLALVRSVIDLADRSFVDQAVEPYASVREKAPADDSPSELLVRVLGPFEVEGPIEKLTPQQRDIVLYLSLHRRGVSLSELATALWPESLRSEKTLRNRMHELRRALGGRVSLGPGWKFDDSVTTDWALFQSWAQGSLEDQQKALSIVRGQPLKDVKGDWASLEGFEAEMEARVVDLALDVSEKLLADGDPEAATQAARAGLRSSPWEERLYILAMRAAADRGAIAEVKTLYAELCALLDVEEDSEPDPETAAIFQELLRSARQVSSRST